MDKDFNMQQAVAEANRCLLCFDAPCSKSCPAGTEPATFIRKLRLKNITGAIRTIKMNNILGGACGVLCPSARLCEKECVAKGLNKPIRIKEIQRALVEHSWKIGFTPFEKPKTTDKKVAVIGAGPAGLACASELAKEGVEVTVYEERKGAGGVLGFGVPNHRFSKDFLDKELDDLKKLGVEFKFSKPIQGEGSAEKLLKEGFDAVFLAPGLWQAVQLKKNGKKIDGVFTAIEFLEMIKSGHDKDIKRMVAGKKVAVIGGGSVAIDCAESAVDLGAKDVYLVYRRAFSQMPAEKDELASALEAGVQFLLLNQPVDFVTSDGGLSGLKLVRTELGEADSSGRRSPKEVPGSEWTLDAHIVIEAIGNEAASLSPTWYPTVKVTGKKLIVVNEKTSETSVRGIFAGGDIVRGPALVVNAISDGKLAAKSIKKFLEL